MRVEKRRELPAAEPEMTPMIDMTFLLIAFFMLLINFSAGDQNQLIRLPLSQLAQPPDTPPTYPITLQMTSKGTVFYGAEEVTIEGVNPLLVAEKAIMKMRGLSPQDATVIIRADRYAKTGWVQELIQQCQQAGFEKYTLRARQESA
ncbi:MAG: biopolymer transporter ExbD [Planctomycetota bacterium]|nr:MAG: biopolymer transporter ExbD [Planctomycetota bacterium]